MPTITRIALLRHGETDWNLAGRLQGWTDIPLNPTGHAQAERAAQLLATEPLSAIVSSPLWRARQTAGAVADRHQLPLHLDERLRERHLGALQGLTRDEVRQQHPHISQHLDERRASYQPPEGESFATFSARCVAALHDALAAHPGGTVLLVAHGGVLDAIHRHLSGTAPEAARQISLPNTSLNWLRHDGRQWHLDQFSPSPAQAHSTAPNDIGA